MCKECKITGDCNCDCPEKSHWKGKMGTIFCLKCQHPITTIPNAILKQTAERLAQRTNFSEVTSEQILENLERQKHQRKVKGI